MLQEEGRVAFDLFAPYTAALLAASSNILAQVARTYPLIIVDEAHDTGDDAWHCIELLAPDTQVICLADLEQQIACHVVCLPSCITIATL